MRTAASLHKAKRGADRLIRAFASFKLAVCLITILAAVLAVAMGLAMRHGRDYSQWFIYRNRWFAVLLLLLCASVFSAAYVRFPWRRRQIGFVITHAGLLMLLPGSLCTIWLGFEGQMLLREGASANFILSRHYKQVTARWVERPNDPPYVFTFESGPLDWKPGTELNLGNLDAMNVRVLNYYHRSQVTENWVASENGSGMPLVRFRLQGPDKKEVFEHFLVDQDYGAEIFVGSIAIRVGRAISDAMLADFLNPPQRQLGEKGTLTMYYGNHVRHASVDQFVGQAIDVGDGTAKVELVHYFANAKLDASGKFQPVKEELPNPLVELKVELPGDEQPYRQVAFAKSPLLNFDGVYERDCPVKFLYEHPRVERATAIEFLQVGDGKIYGRTVAGDECHAHGEVVAGRRIEIPGGHTFTVTDLMPHARREYSFKRAKAGVSSDFKRDAPAAKLRISLLGVSDELWLQCNDSDLHTGTVDTPDGPLRVQFTPARVPLGFSLELIDCQREINRDGSAGAACSSFVNIIDWSRGVNVQRTISMTEPISYRGYYFYQTRLDDGGHGKDVSVLQVIHDPSRPLKKLGGLTVSLGIAIMIGTRSYARRSAASGVEC